MRPDEATPSPSFASKRPKIPVPRAATPAQIGPGRYSPELQLTMLAELLGVRKQAEYVQRALKSQSAAALRGEGDEVQREPEELPGPGAYNTTGPLHLTLFDRVSASRTECVHECVSSAWALSASTRLPAPPTVRTTGDPGAYEPQASTTISAGASAKQSPSIKARQGKSAFNTTSRFASAFDGVPNTPGPGTYEPELQRRANGGAASVFTSGSARACLAPTRRRGVPSPRAGPTSWAIRPGEATTPSPSFASKRPRIPVPRAATPASIGPGRYSPELYRETEKMCR